jgi:hypothetical protein
VILCVSVVAGLAAYVKPEQALDLRYAEVRLQNQLTEMLQSRKLELTLSEAEVNDLLKKQIAMKLLDSSGAPPQAVVQGAQFSQQGQQLVADVNALVKDQWEVGARLHFHLEWKEPYLTATHTKTEIKQTNVPLSWYQMKPLQVNLNEVLPKLIAIKGIHFDGKQLRISFKLRT